MANPVYSKESLLRIYERLLCTANDQLEIVLAKLLPKIIPLLDDANTFDEVTSILELARKRVELAPVKLNLPIGDLLQLINPAMSPKLSEWTVSFLLIGFRSPVLFNEEELLANADKLLGALGALNSPFTIVSNCLCYIALQLLPAVSKVTGSQSLSRTRGIEILADWFLDISVVPSAAFSDPSGLAVIKSGLSDTRLNRIKSRQLCLLSANDAKSSKLSILTSLVGGCIPTEYCVAISVVSSYDSDNEVVTEAVYKMNGCFSLFRVAEDYDNVVKLLLSLCRRRTRHHISTTSDLTNEFHREIRDDIRIAIMHFIVKKLATGIQAFPRRIVIEFLQDQLSQRCQADASTSRYLAQLISLAQVLFEKWTDVIDCDQIFSTRSDVAVALVPAIVTSLQRSSSQFVPSNTPHPGNEATGGTHADAVLRGECYKLLTLLSKHYNDTNTVWMPAPDGSDSPLSILLCSLFRLLDIETDGVIISSLHIALCALHENVIIDVSERLIDDVEGFAVTEALISSITRAVGSLRPKTRLTALQWLSSLFWVSQARGLIQSSASAGANPPSTLLLGSRLIDALVSLSGDGEEDIDEAVVREFSILRKAVRRDSRFLSVMLSSLCNIGRPLSLSSGKSSREGLALSRLLQCASEGLLDVLTTASNQDMISKCIKGKRRLFSISSDVKILVMSNIHHSAVNGENETLDELRRQISSVLMSLSNLVLPVLLTDSGISVMESVSVFVSLLVLVPNNKDLWTIFGEHLSRHFIQWLHDLCSRPNSFVGLAGDFDFVLRCVARCLGLSAYAADPNNVSILVRSLSQYLKGLEQQRERAAGMSITSGAGHLQALGMILQALSCRNDHIDRIFVETSQQQAGGGTGTIAFVTESLVRELKRHLFNALQVSLKTSPHEAPQLLLSDTAAKNACLYALQTISDLANVHISSSLVDTGPESIGEKILGIAFGEEGVDKSLRSMALDCVSRLSVGILRGSDFAFSVRTKLVDRKGNWWTEGSIEQRFVLSEAIFRIESTSQQAVAMYDLVTRVDEISANGSEYEKKVGATILLVLMKQLSISPGQQREVLSLNTLLRIVAIFLRMLQVKEASVQDMCALGLCHVYNFSIKTSDPATSTSRMSEVVAREVVAVLMREKRVSPPAGVAEAGESVSVSAQAEAARALERVLEGRAHNDEDGGDEEGRTVGASSRRRRNASGPVPGTGQQPLAGSDELMAAAAAAAAELGLSREEIAAAVAGNQSTNTVQASDRSSYGIYSSVCKIAKKTGDAAVLFSVLAMIRRDPSFGVGGSREIFEEYRAPVIEISSAKMKDLMPVLYLARFDPSQATRDVMRALWDSLIDSSDERKRQFEEMQTEALLYLDSRLSSRDWKEREAACLALEPLLLTRDYVRITFFIDTLWDAGFAVLDDIRESTRAAGMRLMKVLAETVLRACDPTQPQSDLRTIDQAIAFILPKLLDKGLPSGNIEGRGFVLGVLTRVVNTAKALLKGWRPQVAAILVECMSAFEPAMLQYMQVRFYTPYLYSPVAAIKHTASQLPQFHTTRLNVPEEELEHIRLKLSRESPMQEALDACLQSLSDGDTEVIQESVRALSEHLHHGVGLATRVAAAHAITYITDNYPLAVAPFSAKVFRSMVFSASRNAHMAPSLSKALMTGVGSLSKVASAFDLSQVTRALISDYYALDRDGFDTSACIADCLHQIISHAGDKIWDEKNSVATSLLACAYIGSFEDIKEARESWTKAWEEALQFSSVGLKSSAITRAATEIVSSVKTLLGDLAWMRRAQALRVTADIVTSLSASHMCEASHIAGDLAGVLLVAIASAGGAWSGHTVAFPILASLIAKCIYSYPGHFSIDPMRREALFSMDRKDDLHRSVPILTLDQKDRVVCDAVLSNMSLPAEYDRASWKISVGAVVSLFQREARRISHKAGALADAKGLNADNEIALARAISILPWKLLATEDPLSFVEKDLPKLCDLADIHTPRATLAELTRKDEVINSVHNAIATAVTSTTTPSPISVRVAPSISYSQLSKGVKRGKHDKMFGSRYSYAQPPPRTNLNKPPTHTAADSASTATTGLRSTPNMASSTLSASLLSLSESSNPNPTLLTAVHASTGPSTVSEKKKSPAFRVLIVECIANGWAGIAASTTASSTNEDATVGGVEKSSDETPTKRLSTAMQGSVESLLVWAIEASMNEVWSLRVAALKLLSELLYCDPFAWPTSPNSGGATYTSLDADLASLAVLKVVSMSVSDSKYAKLRAAGWHCLERLLQSSLRRCLYDEKKHLVESLFMKAGHVPANMGSLQGQETMESSSAVIEEALSRARKAWYSP